MVETKNKTKQIQKQSHGSQTNKINTRVACEISQIMADMKCEAVNLGKHD